MENDVSRYSHESISESHLHRLASIAKDELTVFFGGNPHLAA
ncbi:hypothetical protein ACFWVM_31230 [Nocardia fluminea]